MNNRFWPQKFSLFDLWNIERWFLAGAGKERVGVGKERLENRLQDRKSMFGLCSLRSGPWKQKWQNLQSHRSLLLQLQWVRWFECFTFKGSHVLMGMSSEAVNWSTSQHRPRGEQKRYFRFFLVCGFLLLLFYHETAFWSVHCVLQTWSSHVPSSVSCLKSVSVCVADKDVSGVTSCCWHSFWFCEFVSLSALVLAMLSELASSVWR